MVWEHRVVAFNTATESTNRMHDDSVAATFGFRGGLVPGVDVWAYLTRPCVDRWGVDFLSGGTMDARFPSRCTTARRSSPGWATAATSP